MHKPRPKKLLFQIDAGRKQLLIKNGHAFPVRVRLVIECILASGTGGMGVRCYYCSSTNCSHTKYFSQSSKSKGCSTCDMKATEQWIAEQQHIPPDSE